MTADCTIVIPAHNEGRIIADSIRAIRAAVSASWQIIVVDDGSSDSTADAAAEALGGAGKVIRNARCLGKAGAIVEGVQACTTDLLLFTDADLSVPPEFFATAAELLQDADVVIGSRHLPGSKILRRQPWLRQTCGEIFRILVRRMFLKDITDFTCGLKAFRREAAQSLFRELTCLDWTFDVELLLRARQGGMQIRQMPVTWTNRPDSRVRLVAAIFGSLRSLWRLRRLYPS